MLDPSLRIDPIPAAAQTPPPAVVPAPVAPVLDPSLAIVPIQTQPAPVFSAPTINSLEKGRYYLQIAALSKVDSVRSEIAKIDGKLPVAIMNAGSAEKPVYRILIGPMNLGESGALLRRFKVTYKDAFVRLGT
jgi:cell division septation protein DedD